MATQAKKPEKETKNEVSVPDVDVVYKGTQIILPNIKGQPMSFDEAITWMQRKKVEDETNTAIFNAIECLPLDGLYAFKCALAEIYGWVNTIPTPPPHMFAKERPPVMVGIQTGPNPEDVVQAPYGRIMVPGIEGFLETSFDVEADFPKFIISGEVKKKHADAAKHIIAVTERILRENSVYKGKAIKVNFDWKGDNDAYDPMDDQPKFMDLSKTNDSDLIFSQNVLDALNVGLFTPIEKAEACRQNAVPLKRGILLHGPYGTGKTMTANVAAAKALRNGWTFLYLESVADLKDGLRLAAKYAPAVVFAEDIDRVMSGDRSMDMDAILNTLDGVDTKGAEIITVLTTNHIEQINPTMLRMGRLDSLIEVTPPDAEAAERLVRLYSRGMLSPKVDLKKVGVALAGNIPAFIREVTERAKIAAIGRVGNGNIAGHVMQDDLLAAAHALAYHASLLKPKESGQVQVPLTDIMVTVPAPQAEGRDGNKLADIKDHARKIYNKAS